MSASERFRKVIEMLDALAFVPCSIVPEGLELLRRIAAEDMVYLLDYFDTTCVNGTFRAVTAGSGSLLTRMRRRRPHFPPPVWNVLDATLQDGDRTNNACEAWNNGFVKLVGQSHPNIWKLIECLQDDQAVADTTLLQAAIGNPPAKRVRRETVRLQARLKHLCQDYLDHGDLLRHLEGVGSCIRL
ncbi:uncharacterized protein LOC135372074 [Ornithodoros turicata]|uniref:uncharacterized protein LOC135372074 n=1 Tax=Ornithodoros turicata TaxID=34597 RepID=UPI003138F83E